MLGGRTTFTFESTFAVESTRTNTLLVQYGDSTADAGFFALIDGAGTLFIGINENPTSFSAHNYSDLLLDGEQHHFAVSWDNTSGAISIYVDGQLIESQNGFATGIALPGSTGDGTLQFGQNYDSVNDTYNSAGGFNGTLYDARFWSDVRSEAEIGLNYQQKFDSGSLPSGLIANWQMEFNGSSEVVDIVTAGTASENNLSIGNATGTHWLHSQHAGRRLAHQRKRRVDGTTVGFVVPTDPESPQ